MAIMHKGRKLSAREQAAYVRSRTGWTREEYQKKYDVLRNKVRAYEKAIGAKTKQNVSDLLARTALKESFAARSGQKPQYTARERAILSASSTSSGGAPSRSTVARIRQAESVEVRTQFRGVIENSKYKEDIARDLALERRQGTLTPARYRDIVEGYARKLGEEKANIAAMNRDISDPFKRIEWDSKH